MLTPSEIESGLAEFSGTEQYHRHPLGIVMTDGVRWLCENAECFWLLDIIASYQPQCRKDPMLNEAQFWTLTVNRGHKPGDPMAVVTCERDTDDVAIRQEIEHTDFPLGSIRIWVERAYVDGKTPVYVAMLPDER